MNNKHNKNKLSLRQWCIENNRNDILEQWNYKKNDSLGFDINKMTIGSNKIVWWNCTKGHEWKNVIYKMVEQASPCPICNGRRLAKGINDLATTDPKLLKEWDYSKNKDINPIDVTRISRKRAFWKCSKCSYEWSTKIFERTINGTGCPKCAIKVRAERKHKTALKENGYLKDPDLLKDFDYEANYPKTPNDFTPVSNYYAYWKCHKCGYKWKAKVSNRVKGRGCPVCGNRKIIKGINDLATTHPQIAKEWHPTRNGKLTPYDVSYGNGKRVYWLCPKGHEYKTSINHRTSGTGTKCPICNKGRQSSFAEQAVYYYVKKEYPDALNKYKPDFLKLMELDIYIPSRKTAIEYDGAPWHKKDNLKKEQKKYQLCKENGISLWRIREEMPELESDIADRMFNCGGKKLFEYKYLNELIINLLEHLTLKFRMQFDINVFRDEQKILEYVNELNGNTFESEYPKLAKEWHPTKNGKLKPNMFKPHSKHKAWWLCSNCGNEYYARIGARSYGTGCPICGITKSHKNRGVAIEMIDINTNKVVKTFNSIAEASKEMKISHGNITSVCKGDTNRTQAGGYKWRYLNNE